MTTIADVQTEVDRVFDALNAPSWPDPHADNQIAAEEEYSRVTDPQRYRALVLRLQAWQQALSGLSVTSDADPFDIVPDCACDACDSGSQDLLAVLDDDMTALVDGSLVFIVAPSEADRSAFRLVATSRRCALEWGGDGPAPLSEPEAVVDAIRSGDDPLLPEGCVVLHGRPWL